MPVETLHTFQQKCLPLSQPTTLILRCRVVNLYTTRFNIQKSCFKPQSLFKFCVDLRIKRDYFPVEHQLTGFYNRDIVLNERYGLDLRVMYINPSNRVFSICTTRFNTQQFCVRPPQCIYVFCVELRTNSDNFPIQQ